MIRQPPVIVQVREDRGRGSAQEEALLVIGPYRMAFEITTKEDASLVSVFIDYALPESGLARWLGRMLGAWYARWCTRRMANDAVAHFNQLPSGVDRRSDVYERGGLA